MISSVSDPATVICIYIQLKLLNWQMSKDKMFSHCYIVEVFFTWAEDDNMKCLLRVSAVGGVAQLLEGFSRRLLASLKDVLVERNQLTLGKELGKGLHMIPRQ